MSYPGAGLAGGTHFVISKHLGKGKYKPEIVFTLFLPPTGIELVYRMPHSVTAGHGTVHVDSGRVMLGDLTVDLDYGVGPHIYTNAKTGLPQTMKGLRRSRESRKFFTKA